MYHLHDYARMIADEGRMGPYVRALEAVVKPGSVVADIGAGTGIFSLLACRLGARRVYAIETNDVIEVGRELARENGFADRIVFFHKDAREVDLPERADVVVSDLRGSLPLYGDHLAIIADARARFLRSGGVLVPARDRLMVAVVEQPDLYEWALGPARGPLSLTLDSMRKRLCNAIIEDRRTDPIRPENLISSSGAWATLDYAAEQQPVPITGRAELHLKRAGVGHGLVLWVEVALAEGGLSTPTGHVGEGLTTAPGHELCYGRVFLPWQRPLALCEGDVVAVALWAQPGGEDPWGWNSVVTRVSGRRETLKQSSFLACTDAASRLKQWNGHPCGS